MSEWHNNIIITLFFDNGYTCSLRTLLACINYMVRVPKGWINGLGRKAKEGECNLLETGNDIKSQR